MKDKIKESRLVYSITILILFFYLITVMLLLFYNSNSYYKKNSKESSVVKYVIGVSQSQLTDPWQSRIYEDILEESKKYNDIKIISTDAAGNEDKQIDDINKLIKFGIDILIISPTDLENVTEKVSEVYKKVPVIVLDREIDGYDYNLYIGPDNSMVGEEVGEYVNELLGKSGGKVVEITGPIESNATKGRALKFKNTVNLQDNIEVVKVISDNWDRDKVEDEMYSVFREHKDIDVVFAHNDDMAYGAYKAYVNSSYEKDIDFISIEGIEGEFGGVDLVQKGLFKCTFTLPTGGKEAIQYALDILNKEDGLPKKIILRSMKVDEKNISEYKEKLSKKTLISDKSEKISFGFCNVGKEGGWRDANKDSIINAAINADVELLYLESDLSQKKQIEILRGFINMGVDIISFSPVVEDGWDEILTEIKEANIPVIIADRMIKTEDKTLYTAFIGSDFREEGRRAARWIVNNMEIDKLLNIVEIQGIESSTPTIERKLGFEQIIREYNNINLIKSSNANFTFDEGKQVMERYLTEVELENKKIDVVFAHNDDMALGAIEAIEEAGMSPGEDMKIVSIDAIKQAILAIKDGKLNCSVECNPLIGPQIIKLATDIINGKDSPMTIITEESVFEAEKFDYNWLNRKY